MTFTRLKAIACGMTLLLSVAFTMARAQTNVTPAEARAIAKEAYIYGFPTVDSYRIQYGYFVDRQDPQFKAPWNQIRNVLRRLIFFVCRALPRTLDRGSGFKSQPPSHDLLSFLIAITTAVVKFK